MTREQREALAWARSTGLLVRWSDGVWRGKGAKPGDDDFDFCDIKALVDAGLLELTPAGAVPVASSDRYVPRATGGPDGEWAIWDRQLRRFVSKGEIFEPSARLPMN